MKTMQRWLLGALALLAVALTGGCAHPISLTADTGAVVGTGAITKVDRRVAVAISEEQKKLEVTTPGGGGDKVSYFPYRDMETGLYVALSETFTQVTRVSGVGDPKVRQDGVSLILVPEISTTSHSPSLFTWPPTAFTVELRAALKDPGDRTVGQVRVQGEGRAEFGEFIADPSLSAKRAVQDVLVKLVKALGELAPKLP
jgi:hypothetical protein